MVCRYFAPTSRSSSVASSRRPLRFVRHALFLPHGHLLSTAVRGGEMNPSRTNRPKNVCGKATSSGDLMKKRKVGTIQMVRDNSKNTADDSMRLSLLHYCLIPELAKV